LKKNIRTPHGRYGGVSALFLTIATLMLAYAYAEEQPQAHARVWNANNILGSKHDLTSLNQRAGVEAMAGVAYSDYGDACIYCHIPADKEDAPLKAGQLPEWNRFKTNFDSYTFYKSNTLRSNAGRPGDISMLCLSCHDGTMAVDRISFRPTDVLSQDDYSLHMKLNDTDNISSCGKCHDGSVAHDISRKVIGNNLNDDHPIAIRYIGLNNDSDKFYPVDNPTGFDNGIRLYDGNIECATCHDIHSPDSYKLLRTDAETLCSTCHTN
jgi:predicted CXXCH cytochrome family protein